MPSTPEFPDAHQCPDPIGRQAGAAAAPAALRARIVVIDDEPLNADTLLEFLCSIGHAHAVCLSGDDATPQRLREEQPDLVLLELAMIRTDPFVLLEAMQADQLMRHVPVIALTTLNDQASRLRTLELGAVDVLLKPVDGAELTLRLRNTLAIKAHRDQLAQTDQLTGLPNLDSMRWRLEWSLKHSQRHHTAGAVLQLGLERFKRVIDALGPSVGDELLHAVSQRLVASLRDTDTVARARGPHPSAMVARGRGEEFTMLLPIVESDESVAVVARRLIERMAAPFVLAGQEFFINCHIGIAVFPGDSSDRDTVLQQAGVALHAASQAGPAAGVSFQFYSEQLNARSLQRLTMERELHHALERDELVLHYQPQVLTTTGRLCGAEALVRWQHPQRGLLGPDEFIGVAENAGLIARLGEWVLGEALKQLSAWRRADLPLAQVAVNVSSLQLQRADFSERVNVALRRESVDGESLCLELTESAIIDSGPQVTETLACIKRLGVRLALDDFGTGYSSLTYLRKFPIDELKIDRSFVIDCEHDVNSSAITGAIIAMARRLGLRVVAEGVETSMQLNYIRACGADVYQGYLFAKPLPARQFEALLVKEQAARVRPEAMMAG